MTTEAVNPTTGELVDLEPIAAEYLAVHAAHEEALREARTLGTRLAQLRTTLVELLPPDGVVDAGDAVVVKAPPARPAQRVSRSGCEPFAEELLELGLGRMGYMPPGIAAIRAKRAAIIAAGLPLDRIAPTPMAGPPTIEIVPKTAGAA